MPVKLHMKTCAALTMVYFVTAGHVMTYAAGTPKVSLNTTKTSQLSNCTPPSQSKIQQVWMLLTPGNYQNSKSCSDEHLKEINPFQTLDRTYLQQGMDDTKFRTDLAPALESISLKENPLIDTPKLQEYYRETDNSKHRKVHSEKIDTLSGYYSTK